LPNHLIAPDDSCFPISHDDYCDGNRVGRATVFDLH
jgi:hypothetical protein